MNEQISKVGKFQSTFRPFFRSAMPNFPQISDGKARVHLQPPPPPPARPPVHHRHRPGWLQAAAQVARTQRGSDPLSNIYEGATKRRCGATSGTNSPRSCALDSDQWNRGSLHTLFSRTAATDFFSLSLSLSPSLSFHPSSDDCGAAHS